MTSGLSILILKYKFHKYHIVGVIIVLVGILIYTIIEIAITDFTIIKGSMIALYCGLTVLVQLFTGVQECMEKYLMDKQNFNPFTLVSVEGIIGSVILSVSFLPLYYIKCPSQTELHCNSESSPNHSVEDIFDTFDFILRRRRYLGFLALLFIFFLLYNIFRLLTNKHFSPVHRGFADSFGYFLFWVFQLSFTIFDPNKMHTFPYFIFGALIYFIIIFGICEFLNIIVINVGSMNDPSKIDFTINDNKEKPILENDTGI